VSEVVSWSVKLLKVVVPRMVWLVPSKVTVPVWSVKLDAPP